MITALVIKNAGVNKSDVTAENTTIKKLLERKVQKELIDQRSKVSNFLANKNINLFSDYKLNEVPFDFPVFVYESGQLIFWSDHITFMDNNFLKENIDRKTVQNSSGICILSKFETRNNESAYEVVYQLPLYYDYNVQSSYLKPSINRDLFGDYSIDLFSTNEANTEAVYDEQGTYLFSFRIKSQKGGGPFLGLWLALMMLGCILLCVQFVLLIKWLSRKGHFLLSTLILVVVLLFLRWLMLDREFPFKYVEWGLFNPRYFAASAYMPSLGDLLLNIVFIGIIILHVYKFTFKSVVYLKLINMKFKWALLFSIALVFSFYLVFYQLFFTLFSVYTHSQINFDVTENIEINSYKLIYYLIFLLLSSCFFVLSHIVFRLLFVLSNKIGRSILLAFFFGWICYFIFEMLFLEKGNFYIQVVLWLYLLIVFYFNLFKNLSRFKYLNYLYLLATAIVCSICSAVANYTHAKNSDAISKRRFAEQLIVHSDPQGEYLISAVDEQIKQDRFIRNFFKQPTFLLKGKQYQLIDIVEKKIRKIYLGNYFDKYNINVFLYSFDGTPYANYELQGNYHEIEREYGIEEYKTESNGLFYINYFDRDILSKYLNFVEVKEGGHVIGYIVLEFSLKKFIGRSILPRLLQDRNNKQIRDKKFDYAIIDNGHLIYSIGEFNYNQFSLFKEAKKENSDEFYLNGYNHLVIRDSQNRQIIVSSRNTTWSVLVSNFSFLFLITILFSFFLVVVILFFVGFHELKIGFSTKIQVYLNIAFFLPLFIVSITLLSITTSNYENEMKESFMDKANFISTNVTNYLLMNSHKEINQDQEFVQTVYDLSKYSEMDVNLYNHTGKLALSTQPLIYESNLMMRYMNPEAILKIFNQKHKMVLLDEHIGDLNFKSVYVGLYSPEGGEFLGVLSLPFFNSKFELMQNKINVLGTIINTFSAIFIVIVILSYFAFKSLTDPLKLIAQRIKRTTFGGDNEKLVWNTNDEIGALISEYNDMLVKLDKSKVAQARSEKESAWREMAQQVAHEIKNPLTPMKLKLQHLHRMLGRDDVDPDKTKNSVEVLLGQIDTLSDIATSFSAFAKMPTPVNKPFDITYALQCVVNLHKGDEGMELNVNLDGQHRLVNGDEKLLSRTFTNLIINGKQAVPDGKRATIVVNSYLNEVGNKIIIEFVDNGDGISDDIKPKVFIPNFSTKKSGSGIGLAVAKKGVEHAGGKIWFETEEGKGTHFFVELPLTV